MTEPLDSAANKAAEAGVTTAPGSGNSHDDLDEWLNLSRTAYTQGRDYIATTTRTRWVNAYRAYQGEHFYGSKYESPRWRGRSRLFIPRTRSAVRKNDAATAASLFASDSVVQVTAGDEDNENQRANAALQNELLNYRLDRGNSRAGVPWFMVAIGARQDCQITGLCISKQYWSKKTRQTTKMSRMVNPDTGEVEESEVPTEEVIEDKPVIQLYPRENVIRDPGCDWLDQAQSSAYILLRNPMLVGDVKTMIRDTQGRNTAWLDLDDSQIRKAADDYEAEVVRKARDGSAQDRYTQQNTSVHDFEVVWAIENFMRVEGEEWVWWTLGTHAMLSEPRPVREVYPEQGGARPIVIGYGSLETHRIDPQSAVESWAPLQAEVNELTNLGLDILKQNVSPLAKVRRGQQVDIRAIQNRGPDTILQLKALDDVDFDRPPVDSVMALYARTDRLQNDQDDLAGVFNQSSVQSNRSLNETATGMRLLSNAANTVGEFDLRVFIETWVEPTLRMVVKLEQFYEDDARILALAGERAQLRQRFGVDEITDDLMFEDVQVRVNVGIGSADPMQRLQKLQMAAQTVVTICGPDIVPRVKQDEIIAEAFGAAGFRNGKRFFHEGDQTDPRIQQAKKAVADLQAQIEDKQADRDVKVQIEELRGKFALLEQQLENQAKAQELAAKQQMETDRMAMEVHEKRRERATNVLMGAAQSFDRDRDSRRRSATKEARA